MEGFYFEIKKRELSSKKEIGVGDYVFLGSYSLECFVAKQFLKVVSETKTQFSCEKGSIKIRFKKDTCTEIGSYTKAVLATEEQIEKFNSAKDEYIAKRESKRKEVLCSVKDKIEKRLNKMNLSRLEYIEERLENDNTITLYL